jgi:hypothetical protein
LNGEQVRKKYAELALLYSTHLDGVHLSLKRLFLVNFTLFLVTGTAFEYRLCWTYFLAAGTSYNQYQESTKQKQRDRGSSSTGYEMGSLA